MADRVQSPQAKVVVTSSAVNAVLADRKVVQLGKSEAVHSIHGSALRTTSRGCSAIDLKVSLTVSPSLNLAAA